MKEARIRVGGNVYRYLGFVERRDLVLGVVSSDGVVGVVVGVEVGVIAVGPIVVRGLIGVRIVRDRHSHGARVGLGSVG